MSKTLSYLAPLLLLVGSPAALAHGGDEAAQEVHIRLGEMYFAVQGQEKGEPLRLEAGATYELVFENDGNMQHEVFFGRDVVRENGQPSGYRQALLGAVEVKIEGSMDIDGKRRAFELEAHGIEELEFDPGVKLALTFTLPESATGEWELGCFLPGHYQGGMRLPVRVE